MNVAIFECGNFHDSPDVTRVFDSERTAIKAIPESFIRTDAGSDYLYYEDRKNERYINIKTYKVEEEEKP